MLAGGVAAAIGATGHKLSTRRPGVRGFVLSAHALFAVFGYYVRVLRGTMRGGDEPPVFGPQRTSMYATDADDGYMSKINLETHEREWEVEGVVGRPATDGDSVFAPTEEGLLELDADSGTKRWSETAGTVSPDRVFWVGPESIRTVEYGDYLTARYR